ncbi:Thiamine-phosphate synthase [bioreactor metagenome]|uniref:thiamine phosphate synthase n=1 Tax=bioreactor metagenome TaxID=1076179 RepID=A0A645DY16_9ZZZZ
MTFDKNSLLLYAVTDRCWAGTKTLAEQVEEALKGGVTCVQLREKSLADEDFLKEAFEIKALCKNYKVPFFINDNIDVAMRCDADGIHVGQHDMSAVDVRQRIGKKMLLGVSVQTVEQAVKAEKDGADCLGVGAVFSTSTKLDADTVCHDTLKAICSAVSIPVVAIGGINQYNILELKNTGIDGVALVSAIFASDTIESTCRQLRALSEEMVKV